MKDLTEGKEGKTILNFATPLLIGNLFQQLYNIVDSVIVGNFLGKEALAAVGASFPLIFTLISFIIGVASGFTIIIAQYFGAKDMKRVQKSVDTMYLFMLGSGVLVSILGIIFSDDIFRLIDLPEEVLPLAKIYLNIFLGGIVLFFGFNGTSAILRGLGDSKTPLYFLIISTVANVLFDLLFVVVFEWGIAGAAIATIVSQGGAFITAILYLNRTHEVVKLTVRKYYFSKEIFNKAIRIGLPSGFQQSFVALAFLVLIRFVNGFGTATIAAYTVGMRINSLVSLPAMNFGSALSTFVGQNLGANKPERVKKGLRATFLMSASVALVTTGVVILLRDFLMSLFTNDAEVIAIGRNLLTIVSSFYVVFAAMFIMYGVLRGAGDTLSSMFITLFSLWLIRVPAAYFLSNELGATGIWWSMPMGWFIGMAIGFGYYLTGRWKRKVVVKHDATPKSELMHPGPGPTDSSP
ncbi:MAG: MATE family efflux transporter [Bacteroidales bacterium]|nr:MATE family efflux transporter [Bacteroidales bacterium]